MFIKPLRDITDQKIPRITLPYIHIPPRNQKSTYVICIIKKQGKRDKTNTYTTSHFGTPRYNLHPVHTQCNLRTYTIEKQKQDKHEQPKNKNTNASNKNVTNRTQKLKQNDEG